MSQTTPAAIETPTEPVPAADAGDDGCEPDGLEGGLHFGRAWHRYQYCYRRPGPIRVLVAGCGTGLPSIWAARLNPGASVLGIDASAGAVAAARARAVGTDVAAALDFRVHDPSDPLPDDWGRFDFVVCRELLARVEDPDRLLASLAGAIHPEGLLLVTTPSLSGRQVAGAFRRAVDALLPPGAGAGARVEVGLELFQGLRPDHPIRAHVARTRHHGVGPEEAALAVADFLAGRHDWPLEEAAVMFGNAGLTFLYAATPWRWRPDRVLAPDAPGPLADRVAGLAPGRLSLLIDALDPTILDDSYQIYGCPASHTPTAPRWPVSRFSDPSLFERLVPRQTGLSEPARFLPSGAQGRVAYRMVCGTPGELDRWSHLLMGAADGTHTCGEIERQLAPRTRASDDPISRQERWIDLADNGLILLDPCNTC